MGVTHTGRKSGFAVPRTARACPLSVALRLLQHASEQLNASYQEEQMATTRKSASKSKKYGEAASKSVASAVRRKKKGNAEVRGRWKGR